MWTQIIELNTGELFRVPYFEEKTIGVMLEKYPTYDGIFSARILTESGIITRAYVVYQQVFAGGE